MGSPVPKFPEIVKNLKEQGYNLVPLTPLKKEIIMLTGAIKEQTIKRTIEIMELTGFLIKKNKEGVVLWETCDPEDKLERIERQDREIKSNHKKDLEAVDAKLAELGDSDGK